MNLNAPKNFNYEEDVFGNGIYKIQNYGSNFLSMTTGFDGINEKVLLVVPNSLNAIHFKKSL